MFEAGSTREGQCGLQTVQKDEKAEGVGRPGRRWEDQTEKFEQRSRAAEIQRLGVVG